MTFPTEGSVTIFFIKAYLSAPSRSVHLSRITSTPSSTSSFARLSTHVSCAGKVQLYDTNTLGGVLSSSFPMETSTFKNYREPCSKHLPTQIQGPTARLG